MKPTLLLMLSSLLLVRYAKCELYYVRPTDPENVICPGTPCQNLNYYIKQSRIRPLPLSNAVIMILLEGHHGVNDKTLDFGSPKVTTSLHVKGIGRSSETVINKLTSGFTVDKVVLENLSFYNTHLFASDREFLAINITIQNCNFFKSTMILTNVNFHIKDSNVSDSTSTAVSLYSSMANFMGHVRFVSNKGYLGGALALIGTTMKIHRNASLYFKNNHAQEMGGGIYVINPERVVNTHGYISGCFYQLMDFGEEAVYTIQFVNNSANKGGDHIYGASMKSNCIATNCCSCMFSYQVLDTFFWFDPGYESSLSPVSADATRVCACDDKGQPQCETLIIELAAYPGSMFSVPIVLVGGDYGTTTGKVYASFLQESSSSHAALEDSNQYHQVVTRNSECTMLNLSVYSSGLEETVFLTTEESIYRPVEDYFYEAVHIDSYYEDDYMYITSAEQNTPIFLNITLLPCPPGFTLVGDLPKCDCHPVFKTNGVKCIISNFRGFHSWTLGSIWVAVTTHSGQHEVFFSSHCPIDYCQYNSKQIDLDSNPDDQCDFNRAGILCGSCKENYSLAIGSSHCIHCPNNNNVALLIFFAAAGVLLVLLVAVSNLTVTQGMINSLVFYANLIWAYQNILFPPGFEKELIAHKTFIAWLNLDFGIETCFISGMNVYLKTWLQFIFPFYTAGLFLLGVRYSSVLSKLFGDRSVPTLATILLLSYSKLFRTIIACLHLAQYSVFTDSANHSAVVWAMDGNFLYGQYPHIFLLLTSLICFVFLWVPYTVFLISMQWLRRIDHYGPLKLIASYKPLYDAYYAPLKDKHHYWFGMQLFAQGALLLVSSMTINRFPNFNILLVLFTSFILLCYTNKIRVYKKASVLLLDSTIFINVIVLTVGNLHWRGNARGRMVLLSISITIVFIQFCGIVVWNFVPQKMKRLHDKTTNHDQLLETYNVPFITHHSENDRNQYLRYRDSILDHGSTVHSCNDSIKADDQLTSMYSALNETQ